MLLLVLEVCCHCIVGVNDVVAGGGASRVANSLLSQELKLCFSDTKFTKAPYTKKILVFSRY